MFVLWFGLRSYSDLTMVPQAVKSCLNFLEVVSKFGHLIIGAS